MKRLAIVLFYLILPLQLGAFVQSDPPRLAYDVCAPYAGPGGFEILCEIRLSNGDSNTIPLMLGFDPAWSPDGLRIAVGGDDLQVFSLADGSIVRLTNSSSRHGPVRWSPDNARIAFASDRDGQMELYVINADGSALTRLTENVGVRGAFAWSPDGSAIAFTGTVDSVPELFVMRADGSNKVRLTYNVGFDTPTVYPFVEATASWSRDGTRIAFDCANDICSVNADGTNLTRLTTDPVVAFGAVFSPVDDRIAFATGRFGVVEVAIMEENGAVTRVAPGLRAWQHAWSPRGERLAFVRIAPSVACPADNSCLADQNDLVHTVNSDGSGLREIGVGHHPRWATSLPGQPAATFTYGCTGASCQFDATGSFEPDGNITGYRWDFGDGTTGAGATAVHQFATGGTYLVKLTVTDTSGAAGIALLSVWANDPPSASFTAVCIGPTCTFDGSASSDPDGSIVRYTWVFGDGSQMQGPSSTATHTYATGTFLVKLFVGDSGGSSAGAILTLTIVNAVPVASFTVICTTLTCTFDATASSDADGSIAYAWDFGDGARSWDTITTHSYGAPGSYLARLTVTDGAGQSGTVSRTVTVNAPPPVTSAMHVGDLDGSRTTLQKTWNAFATVEIHREDHQPVGGVTVSGTWNDGTTAVCTTVSTGRCVLSRYGIPTKASAVTLTVAGAVHATRVYNPAGNHDPDGGSNGTSLTVLRR